MTIDMNDPETKAAVQALIDDAVTPLKTKNSELLTELKEAKKGKQIDPAEVEKLESRIDSLTGELTAAQKAAKDAAKAAETATKALETETGFTRTLLVQNGLKDTLIKGGVKDEDFLDALVTKFSTGATVVSEGDVRKAMLGDKELSAVVTEYLASDSGKKFVAAPNNGGGGAGGGGGDAKGKTMTRSAFDQLDAGAKMAFSKDGGKVIEQAA
jgi:hypothetical protein